ncbi:hypothetical protein G9A89_005201 [Geosiphon pyriformis]|nr:hypothetical protein G9A89_005201 [Geosiphon pyriformis]
MKIKHPRFFLSIFCAGLARLYADSTPKTLPQVDFQTVTQVGIAGNYNGLTLASQLVKRQAFDGNSASLVTYTPSTLKDNEESNGSFQLIGATSKYGSIQATCKLYNPNGEKYDIYVGGNFTTLGSTKINNIARYDPESQTFSPLLEGLDGPVSSLYCDSNNGSVMVGGYFTAPVNASKNNLDSTSFGGSIALWDGKTWDPLPFKGFNGPVFTISFNRENNTFYFGGIFDATSNGEYGGLNNSQPINLQTSLITSGNGALNAGFNDPSLLACSGSSDGPNNTWLLNDGIPGFIRVEFPAYTTPSSIEIRNTAFDGRGTKSFRILSTPENGIFNLSYVDPNTKTEKYCINSCPLISDNKEYQNFNIVNPISVKGFQIEILDWYGGGGGFHGIRVYQSDAVVMAARDPRFSSCDQTLFQPDVKYDGDWQSKRLPGTWETVSQLQIPRSQLSTTTSSLTLQPYVPQTGFYDVTLDLPSCVPIGCDKTIPINVTVNVAPGHSSSVTISQNQSHSGSFEIYSGTVVSTSSSFAPNVVITVAKPVKFPFGQSDGIILVNFVKFVKRNSSIPLSGLFQYNPATKENATWGGFNSILSARAKVSTIVVLRKSSIAIGGSFSNRDYSNIVLYDGSDFVSLAHASQDPITGFNNIARYDLSTNQWSQISGGVNGEVNVIAGASQEASSKVYISGRFNTAITPGSHNGGNLTYGFVLWDDTLKAWSSAGYVDGQISSITSNTYPTDQNLTTFLGGRLFSVQSLSVFSAGLLTAPDLKISPLIYPQTQNNQTPEITVNSGVFWNDKNNDDKQTVILGGQFQLDNITNVAIQQDGALSGLGSKFQMEGKVNSLSIHDDLLYIGGEFTGNATNTDKLNGLAIYDLKKRIFNQNQPPLTVQGDDSVNVKMILPRKGTSTIIVAGTFDNAGFLNCSRICSWDTKVAQWNNLGVDSLGGDIYALNFIRPHATILLVGGNLILNKTNYYLAQFDFNTGNWSPLGKKDDLPGPVTALSNSSPKEVFLAGKVAEKNTSYIRKWDGSKFIAIGDKIQGNSLITQLEVVPTKTQHRTNDILEPKKMLLISGALSLETYGDVSVALYDGVDYYPYLYSSKIGGDPGNIFSIFFSDDLFVPVKKYLAVPLVILISIVIALALVFFIVAIGMAIAYMKRRKTIKKTPLNPRDSILAPAKSQTDFLDNLNKALIAQPHLYNDVRNSTVKSSITTDGKSIEETAGVAGFSRSHLGADTGSETDHTSTQRIPLKGEGQRNSDNSDLFIAAKIGAKIAEEDAINNEGTNVPGELAAGSAPGMGAFQEIFLNGGGPKTYYAKYEFEAREEAELGFQMGEKIHVIDTNDPVWWMGLIDDGTGRPRQGVFPSNYVTLEPPPYDHDSIYDPEITDNH